MVIVFDTNVWLSELALNTAAGSAVRFYLRKSGAQVALPEVIRLEATYHFEKALTEFVKEIGDNYGRLLAVFGHLKDIVLPSAEQIHERVAALFSGLAVPLIDIPLSIDSAKRSLEKTIEGVPPSGPKNQQFKDGVLWADCVSLLVTDDVYLVTTDGGFYKNRKPSEGLAENLLIETSNQAHKIGLSPIRWTPR
jgi:hypothetical protein